MGVKGADHSEMRLSQFSEVDFSELISELVTYLASIVLVFASPLFCVTREQRNLLSLYRLIMSQKLQAIFWNHQFSLVDIKPPLNFNFTVVFLKDEFVSLFSELL